MAFNVYDPKGFATPYTRPDWRAIEEGENVPSLDIFHGRLWWDELPEEKPSENTEDLIEQAIKKQLSPSSRRQPPLLAFQVMSYPVKTLRAEQTLADAHHLLNNHRFRHIPILNKKGYLCGILSDRNLAKALALISHNISKRGSIKEFCLLKIQEVMTQYLITTDAMTEIFKIAQIFVEKRIGSMPIVDADRSLLGIITRSDILRTLLKTKY